MATPDRTDPHVGAAHRTAAARSSSPHDWMATERLLGFARISVAAIGVAQLAAQDFSGPPVTIALAWVAAGVLLAVGVAGSAAASRGTLRRDLADRAAWVETFALATLLPAATDEHTAFVVLVLLVMGVLGGLRDGRAGTIRGIVVGSVFEVVRQVLSITLEDHVHVEDSVTGVLLACAMGFLVGHVADLSRRRADTAHEAVRQLDVQHRVVLAGVGAPEQVSLQRMADELADSLTAASVTIVLAPSGGPPVVVASSDPALLKRRHPRILPGGPLDRTLRLGEVALASDEHLAVLGDWLPPRGSVSSAPIRRGQRVLGALCIDTPPGVVLDADDLEVVARLADQMSLVIEAARALDHEATLAARFRDLDQLKTDFVAVTSHELRTPLTAIHGGVATLDDHWEDMDPATRVRILGLVRRQTERLQRLVDDLSTVSTLDTGSVDFDLRPTRVRGLVHAAVSATGHLDDVLVDGPDAAVLVDPDRLEQVVVNLVRNAFDHGARSAEATWRVVGEQVELAVQDDGPGIPDDHRADVFRRFFQVEDTAEHAQGTGLGLAIARELTESMDGTLELAPSERGARFVLRLPLVVDEPAVDESPADATPVTADRG